MRPVNLIPSEERGQDRAPLRTGALSYVLLGALGLALLGVIALVLTNKQVSDKKSEIASLQQQEQEATAKANSLSAFTNFRTVQEQRQATVSSLAQSRFDWQRVMNELARIIPSDVWLVQLGGTVSPGVSVENAPEISSRTEIPGPALEIVGCTTSQDAVAGFISDLEEIDGVTRVGVQSSQLPDDTSGGTAAAQDSASSDSSDCQTRNFIIKFEIVVAFDKVPTPSTATAAPSVPPAATAGGSEGSQLTAQATAVQGGQ